MRESGDKSVTSPGDLIAVAAIIFGFGITVFMFRIQREIWVKDHRPYWPNWLACSDYLILASIGLAFLALTFLIASPGRSARREALASAACVAALVLQLGFIPAILAHYRIEIGAKRGGYRQKGEPAERRIVGASSAIAAIVFTSVLYLHLCE